MGSIKEAQAKAERLAGKHKPYGINKTMQTDTSWVFYVGPSNENEIVYENLPMILVDKSTMKAKEVYMPSREGAKVLASAVPA